MVCRVIWLIWLIFKNSGRQSRVENVSQRVIRFRVETGRVFSAKKIVKKFSVRGFFLSWANVSGRKSVARVGSRENCRTRNYTTKSVRSCGAANKQGPPRARDGPCCSCVRAGKCAGLVSLVGKMRNIRGGRRGHILHSGTPWVKIRVEAPDAGFSARGCCRRARRAARSARSARDREYVRPRGTGSATPSGVPRRNEISADAPP
jgi:hypothetical protein